MATEWKKNTGDFELGETFFLGKWKVGSVYYDSLRTRGDPLAYKATCSLPGIKAHLGTFETTEQAKAKVEFAVNYWVNRAELKK